MSSLIDKFEELINPEIIFTEGRNNDNFVGRPFYLDYSKAHLLISDAWKHKVKGIPQGTFLLAFYDGEDGVDEALLLRALNPTRLPTDNSVVSSMIEYYKDDLDISGRAGGTKENKKLDDFTRYEFSFSGLECRILGVFYKVTKELTGEKNKTKTVIEFGADVENFYSANNYKVFKATSEVLKKIVNQRDGKDTAGSNSEFAIGAIRYSSSRRFQSVIEEIKVYISPKDFLGKRTASFGMTRTGKSNTIKKVIQATVEISKKAKHQKLLDSSQNQNGLFGNEDLLEPFDKDNGSPKFPVGQIIFDINGEYANPNMQDEGTAIYELYKNEVIRYSVLPKVGFEVMKVNFYKEIFAGFELISNYFRDKKADNIDYLNNFLSINLEKPEDYDSDISASTRYDRLVVAYLCCLKSAGFQVPKGFKVKFKGCNELNSQVRETPIVPDGGITLEDASIWFSRVWENYDKWDYLVKYSQKKGHEWADEDLKAVLAFLTRKKTPHTTNLVSGFRKLKNNDLISLHTDQSETSFEDVIISSLRTGKIIIVDLSQGAPEVQKIFSEKICHTIFSNSMARFINNNPNNFIQFYFEEAHNLFPKKDDSDLSQIYNRIAKEGAKLNLGMIYATQEVSSISSNILKNTQNWFIAHLNNEDELKEIRKYYDFADFTDSLVRFSSNNDKGFVRMKTYTNPFVVPVQIDRFLADLKK